MTFKAAVVMGTRPEVIKLGPVVQALKQIKTADVQVVVTGQHRQMLDQALAVFGLSPDVDFDLMQENQTLPQLTARVVQATDAYLAQERPDVVLVQGDTTTTFGAALAAHFRQVPVGHVEAGLRTAQRYNPFPEEMNRRLTTQLASYHFAPTAWAAENLARENVAGQVLTTGNTIVDALLSIHNQGYRFPEDHPLAALVASGHRLLLLTTHRRESFGQPMRTALAAIRELLEAHKDLELVFPIHLNPNVRAAAKEALGSHPRIHLVEPMDYTQFVHLMGQSFLILSDSGGIQEEAPSLGKPVLLLRETTERPEAIEAGVVVQTGTDRDKILAEATRLLDDPAEYARRSAISNPYGDGKASGRIAAFLEQELGRGECF